MKRCFDLVLLLLVAPAAIAIGVAVAGAVWLRLGSPVIFWQTRTGMGGRSFAMCKFRTMSNEVDEQGNLLPDSQRLNKFGMWLRASSLDELPEIWNVLKGDMSFVGPRPLHARYLERYSPEQARRHEVRPGITGWAQVNGRNALTWNEKFKLDIWYVDHHNFLIDVKIILYTFLRVARRDGISSKTETTMSEFTGSQ